MTQSMNVTGDMAAGPAADAATVRGGATRLARRLRSERPAGALSSHKISLLSHLTRHGPGSPDRIAVLEHHQAPEMIERAARELLAAGLIGRIGTGPGSQLSITDLGVRALAEDGASRDTWLAEVLATLPEVDRRLLRDAALLMNRIANRHGTYQHLPGTHPTDADPG